MYADEASQRGKRLRRRFRVPWKMFKWIVDRINTDERLVDLRSQVYLLISSFLLVFAFLGVIRITMTSRRFVKKSVIMKEMRIYNDVTNVFQVCITPSYVVDISDVTLVVLAKSYCFLFYMCRENRTLKINKKIGHFFIFFWNREIRP